MNAPQKDHAHKPVPRHVAIIMDGNGRWAKAKRLPRKVGHQRGVDAVRKLVRSIEDLGIKYLTLYGFSSENWSRPEAEVNDLMGLLRLYIRSDLKELNENNVCIKVIGERQSLAPDLIDLIDDAERTTEDNTGLNLVIAFNYGGRDEIAGAARKLAQEVRDGSLALEDVTPALLTDRLYTATIPDPDLVIRTSGEQRLSNFLTWQSAYSEFVFIPTLWPDFTKQDLIACIAEYHGRERRFGGRPDALLHDETSVPASGGGKS